LAEISVFDLVGDRLKGPAFLLVGQDNDAEVQLRDHRDLSDHSLEPASMRDLLVAADVAQAKAQPICSKMGIVLSRSIYRKYSLRRPQIALDPGRDQLFSLSV